MQGNLIWPLLLDHVTTDMRLAWEEPFGPVIPVVSAACFYASHVFRTAALNHVRRTSLDTERVSCHGSCCRYLTMQSPSRIRVWWSVAPSKPVHTLQVRVKTIEEAIDHTNANNLALQVRTCILLPECSCPLAAPVLCRTASSWQPSTSDPPHRITCPRQSWSCFTAARADLLRRMSVVQGCVFTQDVNQAIYISDAMETGTVQVNAAPARGPDVSPFGFAYLHAFLSSLPPPVLLSKQCAIITVQHV